jgi:hypothetical protein
MEKKGLCLSCANFSGCILRKGPVIWQCEEFSSGNHAAKRPRLASVRRVFSSAAALESE